MGLSSRDISSHLQLEMGIDSSPGPVEAAISYQHLTELLEASVREATRL